MKINDTDRLLAKELAEIVGGDDRTEKMLAVVLWAHRQLPADEKPAPDALRPGLCNTEPPHVANTITPPRCQRAPGHPGPHESVHPGAVFPTRWDYG